MPSEADWERLRDRARRSSNGTFAREVSRYVRLTEDEVRTIAPEALDRERLAELMAVVTDAARDNAEKAEALRKTRGLAEVAISILGKVL